LSKTHPLRNWWGGSSQWSLSWFQDQTERALRNILIFVADLIKQVIW
jgi:hypothetical protein